MRRSFNNFDILHRSIGRCTEVMFTQSDESPSILRVENISLAIDFSLRNNSNQFHHFNIQIRCHAMGSSKHVSGRNQRTSYLRNNYDVIRMKLKNVNPFYRNQKMLLPYCRHIQSKPSMGNHLIENDFFSR